MDTSESYEQSQSQMDHQMMQIQQQPQQSTIFPTSFQPNGFPLEQIQDDELLEHQSMHSTAIPLPPPSSSLDSSLGQTPITTQSNEIDIDSCLLQQFSCLGTTDHDDLIHQFQSLMNNQIDKDNARFFLEMSNWNLQTAVGCYLDFCNFQTIPSMKIVKQFRLPEGKQAWRFQNDGNENWPKGCYLMSTSQTQRIQVPSLNPGDTLDILADIPPTQPPVMWRLCTPSGWYFGEAIWMVPGDPDNELVDRMSQLRTTNTNNQECVPQVNVVILPGRIAD